MILTMGLAVLGALAIVAQFYALFGTLTDMRLAKEAGINGPYRRAARVAFHSQIFSIVTMWVLVLVLVSAALDPAAITAMSAARLLRAALFITAYISLVARSWYIAYAYHRDLATVIGSL